MKAAVLGLPGETGIELANWNWRAVRHFVLERFGIGLSCSTCLNYLHRLGFALKRPKKRLLKPESTEGRPLGQPLKKPEGAPLNLG